MPRAKATTTSARSPRRSRRRKDSTDPTHYMKVWPRDGSRSAVRVGAVWENARGGLSIKLNPGVVLDWHDFTPDGEYLLTIWPNDDFGNGEIPF